MLRIPLRRALAHLSGRLRPLVTLVAAMTLLLVTFAPAAAAATTSIYMEKVHLAAGAWLTETETTFSDLTIRVFNLSVHSTDGKAHYKTPQVVLFYRHEETDPDTNTVIRTEYEGFVGSDATARFTFDRALGSASARIAVPVNGFRCVDEGPAGIVEPCVDLLPATVHVDIAWTGTGEIVAFSDGTSVHDPSGGLGFHSKLKGTERSAVLSGTIAGDGLVFADGVATVGFLLKGFYVEKVVTTD